MKDDRLINRMKDILSGHEHDVPDDVWKKIEAGLPATPAGLRLRFRKYYAVAAMLAAVVALTLFLTHQQQDVLPPTTQSPVTIVEKSAPVGLLDIHAAIPQSVDEPLAVVSPEQQIVKSSEQKTDVLSQSFDVESISVDDAEMLVATTETPVLKISEKEPVFDEQAMAAISRAMTNKIPRNWFSVKANAMTAGTTTPVQYITRAGATHMTYRHNMPLALTASFEKRFGRWGIGSGLTYTFMSADYEMPENARKGTQSLHYLGIPVYVSFQVAQVKRFSFYASAGGEVDFNISGTQRESSDSQAYPLLKEESVRDKKPQFSVQAHIGAAFELFKRLDLYVEPTLGYYIPNNSATHSIWHDRPWNVSLSLGLRKGF